MPKNNKKKLSVIEGKKEDNKKEDNKKEKKKFKRIHMQLKKITSFYVTVDVPFVDDYTKENLMAIRLGWNIIDGKNEQLNPEDFICGDGFEQTILKREDIEA